MAAFRDISIRTKLIIIQLATAFMAVLICCSFFFYNDLKTFKYSSVQNKISIIEIIGINAAPTLEFSDKDAANKMLMKLKTNPSILNTVILDKEGKEFARYSKPGEEQFSFPPNNTNEVATQRGLSQRFIVSYQIIDKDFLGTVIMRAELSDFTAIILNYLEIAFAILLASLFTAFFISTLLQKYITDQVLRLVETTRRVAQTGDYSMRVATGGQDEVGILSGTFNDMLGQIEKMKADLSETNIELERRVKKRTAELETANKELELKSEELTRSNQELSQYAFVASHDLQEPLRTITNYVGLLEEKYAGQNDDETLTYTRFVVKSAATMKNLINHLLDYSRIGRNVSFSQVDLDKILTELIEEMKGSITENRVKVIAPKLPVLSANAIEIKHLFQNLISNGIKFRKKGIDPIIEITAEERANEWLFAIKDNGIGMEEKNYEKIFIIFQKRIKICIII